MCVFICIYISQCNVLTMNTNFKNLAHTRLDCFNTCEMSKTKLMWSMEKPILQLYNNYLSIIYRMEKATHSATGIQIIKVLHS